MRLFQRIVRELRAGALKQQPGEVLRPPALLPSILIDGRRLSYAAMGLDHSEKTSPVVFVHGFGGFFLDWVKVMAHVGLHSRAYALDLPGWGFSELNPHAAGIQDDAEVVHALIESLGLRDVVLCGISYGAGVSWAAAAQKIPNVRHVVLLNPMPPRPLEFMHSTVYRGVFTLNTSLSAAVFGHRFLSRSMYEMICRETLLEGGLPDEFYLDMGFRAIKQPGVALMINAHAKAARGINWLEWEEKLRGVQIPVSILQSPEDAVFSPASAQHIQSLIPNSQLIEVLKSGHAMVFDQHKKISDFLIKIIESNETIKVSNVGF
jgi:pimeloyl-ACP methyl ester carboxylesterase